MGRFIDLTGHQYGNALVLERAPNRRVSSRTTFVMWKCKCLLCNNEFVAKANNLKSGNTTSCGCNNKECVSKAQLHDLVGQKFGRLTVMQRGEDLVSESKRRKTRWICKCECGKECLVQADKLINGETKSCGCYKTELASKRYTHDLTGKRFGHLVALKRVSKPGSPVLWECVCDCGNVVTVRALCLSKGITQSCGCKMFSIGAEKVANALKENNVKYMTEYKFKDLYTGNKHYLRFDFALFDKETLVALIEYQGQQHYKEVINEEFGKQQREVTDPMKRAYCKAHNIPLFEIRYDSPIEESVNAILTQLSLKHANPVPSP